MQDYRIQFADLDWESPLEGVRHKVGETQETKLRLVEFSADMPPHWCEVGHVGQILDGTFEIEFAATKQIFNAGDGVLIPSGHAHRHRAKTLTPVVRAIFVEHPS